MGSLPNFEIAIVILIYTTEKNPNRNRVINRRCEWTIRDRLLNIERSSIESVTYTNTWLSVHKNHNIAWDSIVFSPIANIQTPIICSHELTNGPDSSCTNHLTLLFVLIVLRKSVLFVGPLIARFWTSGNTALSFKACVVPFTYVLCHLSAKNSLDSPLVRHLLISWHPAWQPSQFDPRPCTC